MGIIGFNYDVSLIKTFAEDKGFFYYLTRNSKDFLNLVDEPHEGLYLFQAQGNVRSKNNSMTGGFISKVYTGSLWVAKVSNLDGVVHEDKIQEVERILALQIDQDIRKYFCKDYNIQISEGKPFYNLFTTNYDGVLYDYTIEVDELFTVAPSIKDNYIRNGLFE